MNVIILILNIFGTFLLSVEAIKTDNLVKFRKYLKKSNRVLNPRIEWVDERTEEKSKNKFSVQFFFLKVVIGFFPISFPIMYYFLKTDINLYIITVISVFVSFVVWTIFIYGFELTIKGLILIENNVMKGIIGIIGFVILTVSFVLQYLFTLINI